MPHPLAHVDAALPRLAEDGEAGVGILIVVVIGGTREELVVGEGEDGRPVWVDVCLWWDAEEGVGEFLWLRCCACKGFWNVLGRDCISAPAEDAKNLVICIEFWAPDWKVGHVTLLHDGIVVSIGYGHCDEVECVIESV